MDTEQCCCGNERVGQVPIRRVVEKLDACFARNDLEAAGRLLRYWESEARQTADRRGLLEILDEEIGYTRRVNDADWGLRAVGEALAIVHADGLEEMLSGATILLNCATTLKAFGRAEDGMGYYKQARTVYERLLEPDDPRLAGLYNNMATACVDLKRFSEAEKLYQSALQVLRRRPTVGEQAVSYVNLAHLYFEMDSQDPRVDACLDDAIRVLDDPALLRDGSYAFIVSKCAPSLGFFGRIRDKKLLETRAEEIYARS